MSVARASLALLASLSLPASVRAWCDPSGALATVDGSVGAGEYPGNSTGSGSGFGAYLGAGAELYVDSATGGGLAFALDSTGGSCAPAATDAIVLYVDAVPGVGFVDTAGFTDNVDGGRAAASGMGTDGGRATLVFPDGFAPESAIVIEPGFAGLFRLVGGGSHAFVRALALSPGFATSCVKELGGISMADLGTQPGNPLRVIGTLLNSANGFRSNEFQGATGPGANIGIAPYTIPATLGVHVESFGPPVALSGTFAYLDFEEYAGAGFAPSPTCGQLSSNGFAATGWSDGDLAFGGTRTTSPTDYTRGVASGAVTTSGFYAFDVGGATGRAFGIQPGGSDFAPGTLTVRLANQGTTTISAADVAYQIAYRNDQPRATSVDFAWSIDGSTFTTVAALQLVTPLAASGSAWVAAARSTSLSSISVPPGGFLYLRFSAADAGGSGSRDELAIDDLVVRPTFTTCGNGSVEVGEVCDLGASNGASACGCQWTCAPASAGTSCGGALAGACDAADTCDGAGTCVDRVASAGTVCAAAVAGEPCDAPDVCDGVTVACTARFAAAGAVCAAADPSLPCDAADVCTGTSLACSPRFAPSSTECRAAVSGCDAAEFCSGSSTMCPADAAAPAGTSCGGLPSGVCDAQDVCTGTVGATASCSPRFAPSSTECRAAVSGCDAAEFCSGSSTMCPDDAAAPAGTSCGGLPSGVCDAQDVCTGTVGATASCSPRFAPSSTECRAAVSGCDAAEFCTGSGTACPSDAAAPAGTSCGGLPSGVCDAQDVCTGTVGATASCSPRFAPSSTVCRAAAPGGCDVAENCTGVDTACPSDVFAPSTTVCRATTGSCDLAENCTGLGAACPTNAFAPSTTVCRAAAPSGCDVAESCSGAGALCPSDAAAPPGTACGLPPSGPCDAQDVCVGTIGATASCATRFAPASTVCRPANASGCDVAESCTGSATACPSDAAAPPGTACGGAPSGGCDAQDVCAGTVGASATCVSRVAAAGAECRATAGVCDVAEVCDGASPGCPDDQLAPPGIECREAADRCDVAEVCSGGSVLCPVDDFALAGTECRPMMSSCDLAEVCDGLGIACPVDGLDPTCDCTGDADCADASVCTVDTCAIPSGSTVGACSNERIAGCCERDADCAEDDGDLCTSPRCDLDANACLEEPVVCDDGDLCTTDACAPADGSCTFEPVPGCGVDAGAPDAGVVDAGPPDAGAGDSGPRDAGARDGGASDVGAGADAGELTPVSGCGCRASAGGWPGGLLWLGALLGLALARRR
jgi:hypothetical protein